jgi:hypothetical protein
MSTNHARDDWADARTDEALRRELDALAGLGATSSGLDGALGTVRSRVRRRRAAKRAGLGATTLAIAGGLVVGGASLLPEPPPDHVPAVSPTPSPSGTPEPSASPTTDASATTDPGFTAGRPLPGADTSDLTADWTCGADVDELLAPATADDLTIELVGPVDVEAAPRRATTRITDVSGDGVPEGYTAGNPVLLWTQGGVVVDGYLWFEGGTQWYPGTGDEDAEPLASLEPGGSFETVAQGRGDAGGWGCGTVDESAAGPRPEYTDELPEGEYQVYAVDHYSPTGDGEESILASEPVSVTVPPAADDGSTDAAADGGGQDCSTDNFDVVPPDLSGLPDPVRATATELFDAAADCDDTALTERAETDGTSTNFGGRTAAEFWGLPGAEEHEPVYQLLAQLVTATDWTDDTTGDGTTYIWPRVASSEHADDDAAWQDVIDAGVIDADLADDMRQNEGYLGWRLGIHEDGTWWYFIAGD